MNQPQPTPPYMGQPKPAVNKWLLVIFIIVVLAGAGFFWYYFFGPGKTSGTTTTTPATTTTTDETADWKTYKNDTYGYSIKYPTTIQYKEEEKSVIFSETSKTNGPSVLTITLDTVQNNQTLDQIIQNKTTDKSFSNSQKTTLDSKPAYEGIGLGSVSTYDIYSVNGNYVYNLSFATNNKDTLADLKSGLSTTQKNMLKTFKFTSTSTSTTTSTDLTYTNSTYGLTMTFPAAWKGYKFKEANLEGATITYYVEVPTTDKSATGDSTADAGYYSPFAISVYTLDQWNTVEASEGPKDTLITKNDQYAFGWSQANGVPPSDFTMSKDIQTIIDSFKLK